MKGEKHKYPVKWYKQKTLRAMKHMTKEGKTDIKKWFLGAKCT